MLKQKFNILLAEDDINLGLLLVDYLQSEGYVVSLCRDGEQALLEFERKAFDICLLDVMMPKKDGYSVAEAIRTKKSQVPIIFITAKSLKEDRLKGYSVGADDYITKPFDEEELLCKIQAITRRTIKTSDVKSSEICSIGKYTFDYTNQALLLNGNIRRMTEKETEILKILSNKRNQVIKREEFLLAVWGTNDYFIGRSLDVFITKIRKYLSEDDDLKIENVFGVGFILNDNSKINEQ